MTSEIPASLLQVIIFFNSLTHFARSMGWRPCPEVLQQGEDWIVATVNAFGGVERMATFATLDRYDERWPGLRARDANVMLWAWHHFERALPLAALQAGYPIGLGVGAQHHALGVAPL